MSDTKEKIPDPVGGSQEPIDDEEKLTKDGLESTETLDDVQQLKKTEELEVSTSYLRRRRRTSNRLTIIDISPQARLASGEATEDEYRVETAHDIAIKVLSTRYVLTYYLT